ncbi:hypothetical protein OSTOST_04255 [Ostertagia ostertagi]
MNLYRRVDKSALLWLHSSFCSIYAPAVGDARLNLTHQDFFQLCLRHFGYDASQAIDALLARDEKLPMALRRLEAADLTHKLANEPPTLPALSFQNDELLQSVILRPQDRNLQLCLQERQKGPESKNVFKGLISLAPQRPAVPTSSAADSQEEKPVSEVMKKLREALERLKVRVSEGEFEYEEQVGVHGERLMPMTTSKTYISTHKFKVSEADKVAIRPTYEKYRYETPGDDVYDDEYDDGYEQKEFTVEPLKGFILLVIFDHYLYDSAARKLHRRSEGESTDERSRRRGTTRGGWRGGDSTEIYRAPLYFCSSSGQVTNAKNASDTGAGVGENTSRGSSYTGGRQRQMKERHKNGSKQRQLTEKFFILAAIEDYYV